jgi:hypothetical protein
MALTLLLSSVSPISYSADNNLHLMMLFGSNLVSSGDTRTYVDPQGDVFSNRLPTLASSRELEYFFNGGNDQGTWFVQLNSSAGTSTGGE